MSRCDEIREMLALWAGGDLPDDETAAVEEHLAACAECRCEAQAWRGDLDRVRRVAGADDGPEIAVDRIDAAVDKAIDEALATGGGSSGRSARRSPWTRVWQVAAPLAAMLAVALVWRFVDLPGPGKGRDTLVPGVASWSELQEEFGGCLSDPVAPDELHAESAGGLVVVLAPVNAGAGYVVADCIEVRDLARLRRFPWLAQRLDRYRATDEGDREIMLAACPSDKLSRTERRGLRDRVMDRFGGSG